MIPSRKFSDYVLPTLLLGLSASGCDMPNPHYSSDRKVQMTGFTEHYVGRMSNSVIGGTSDNVEVRVGDFDGDGDLDFIVIGRRGHIFLYENTINSSVHKPKNSAKSNKGK